MNAIGISLAIILNLLITLASIGILTVLISNPWAWDILAFIVSFWGGGGHFLHNQIGFSGKEAACQCRRHKRHEGNVSWSRAWQPTPVFLPGESHGQSSLVDFSP